MLKRRTIVIKIKICKKCGNKKSIDEFYKNRWECKECRKEFNKEHYQINKDKIKKYNKEYQRKNKEYQKKYNKEYRKKNYEKLLKQKNEYRKKNRKQLSDKQRKYYKRKRDKILIYHKKYANKNKNKIRYYKRNWHYKKYKNDPIFNLIHRQKSILYRTLKSFNKIKTDRTLKYLGCTKQQLKQYIESQFTENMSWEGVLSGDIQIDHKIPIAYFKKIGQIEKAFHYKNLQPLWKSVNRIKSSYIIIENGEVKPIFLTKDLYV